MQAAPSLPAARAYLAQSGAPVLERYNGVRLVRGGYELYFTIVRDGDRKATQVKICESKRGRVTGSADISDGDPTC